MIAKITLSAVLVAGVAIGTATRRVPEGVNPKAKTVKGKGKCAAKPLANPHKAKYRIGIIDTGYSDALAEFPLKLCEEGHYDFSINEECLGVSDTHGSEIATIIANHLQDVDYCAVIYQLVGSNGQIEIPNMLLALEKAQKEHLNAINISLVGVEASFEEENLIRILSDNGTRVFAAAGNDNRDLDAACIAYPACYDIPNLYSVGALTPDHLNVAHYSNHGTRVKLWYAGIYSTDTRTAYGTSFAAPRALADYIYALSKVTK